MYSLVSVNFNPYHIKLSAMSSPFVTQFPLELHPQLKMRLIEKGFDLSQPAYTLFQAKSPLVHCTLYSSGKIVVQGKGTKEFLEFFLEPEFLFVSNPPTSHDLRPRIGVDESGKGDFFGPLCIAGVYAQNADVLTRLYNTRIKDSKTLNAKQITELAQIIQQTCKYDVITLYPEKYNELYSKFKNLNSLLAWGHATVIDSLSPTPSGEVFAISDQFASSESVLLYALSKKKTDIQVIQKVRAEEDIVVAAASILAREAFVSSLKKLENRFSVVLPKGASSQTKKAGETILKEKGKEVLSLVCKTHFKTFAEICHS